MGTPLGLGIGTCPGLVIENFNSGSDSEIYVGDEAALMLTITAYNQMRKCSEDDGI